MYFHSFIYSIKAATELRHCFMEKDKGGKSFFENAIKGLTTKL